ncbi:hypothetical protein KKI93_18955 [Xenorhabdus bovienii]|uniref:type I polyketide synthase n=1 Tax=Xenorhabdus bovienii TaxID=40576 RepID=UPI0023B31FCB|nr:type I polyketide synthase [Xenorhabdus bovienii]MDE9566074.1 hypothetical protein [Xenorhabdus bovienii]
MSESIENAIAIIGMSCKLPVGETPEQFWQALVNGVEAVNFLSDQQLLDNGVPVEYLTAPNYVKAAVELPARQFFDASFFGISPLEANLMDPQQRLLLECSYHALEHGGYAPEQNSLETGVFVGADPSSYFVQNILSNPQMMVNADQMQLIYTNSSMATQIAYRLNLKGPSLDVNTACSTSLVAVHLACRSLLLYECDMALAGGASVQAAEPSGYQYRLDGILSPDGHCRAFDASAAGTVPGQGVVLVLLKRYEDALRDGDSIYALIRGSAINNDGANKVGYTAPSVDGQIMVMKRALAMAELLPEQISYVECHGTGTSLGDPIELTALSEVYGGKLDNCPGECYLGSLKTNLGHLNSAAGVAGLLKAALALHHQKLPPSLNFTQLTPKVDLGSSRLIVNPLLREWGDGVEPLRAAVSSFGIGGTNAHAVLEEYVPFQTQILSNQPTLLTLSAKTPEALDQKRRDFAAFLKTCPDNTFVNACYTANVGRSCYKYRYASVSANPQSCISQLVETNERSRPVSAPLGVVFVLHNGGVSLIKLGSVLYINLPYFRQIVDMVAGKSNRDLAVELLSGEIPTDGVQRQMLVFTVLYALVALWMHWGVRPTLMIGDEIGELVAACHAGVLDFGAVECLVRLRIQHSDDWARDSFISAFDKVLWAPPKLPYISSLTGINVETEIIKQKEYWLEPRQQSVFLTAVCEAADKPELCLLIFSETSSWNSMFTSEQQKRCFHSILSSDHDGLTQTVSAAAKLWENGIELDWRAFYEGSQQRIAIPTYPFQSQRYWLDILPNSVKEPLSTTVSCSRPLVSSLPTISQSYVPPCTEVEREIAAIWSQLLGVEQVGMTDDFFDLGGHSLLATQINARIYTAFGIQLTLDDLFDKPTIKGTVELLMQRQ